jgi:hypothetical protein
MQGLNRATKWHLSVLTENEDLKDGGTWKFANDEAMRDREKFKWASWDNLARSGFSGSIYYRRYRRGL